MATIAPTQHPATLVKQGSQRPSQIHVGHVLPLPSSIHLTKVNKTRCEETGTTAIKHPAFDHFHRKANIQMRASPILWFFALPIVVLFHYFFLPFWWARQRLINRMALKSYVRWTPPGYDRAEPPAADDPSNPWLRVVSREDPITQTYEGCDFSLGLCDLEEDTEEHNWILLKADLAIYSRLKKTWWAPIVGCVWAPYILGKNRIATAKFVRALVARRRERDGELYDAVEQMQFEKGTLKKQATETASTLANYHNLATMINAGDYGTLRECQICFEVLSDTVNELACGHEFHTTCMTKWVRKDKRCKVCVRCDKELTADDLKVVARVRMIASQGSVGQLYVEKQGEEAVES